MNSFQRLSDKDKLEFEQWLYHRIEATYLNAFSHAKQQSFLRNFGSCMQRLTTSAQFAPWRDEAARLEVRTYTEEEALHWVTEHLQRLVVRARQSKPEASILSHVVLAEQQVANFFKLLTLA